MAIRPSELRESDHAGGAEPPSDSSAVVAHGDSLTQGTLRQAVDRYAGLPVIEQREEPPATQPRARWLVTKLVRDSSFKYPLIRVQERWQQGTKGPVLLSQSAMVADHVMVRLKPSARLDLLLQRFKRLNPELRRRLPAANVWIVSFQAPHLDTVPQALEIMRRATDLVEYVDPDHLAHVSATPNDFAFSNQWGLHNSGQSGGTVDVDVDGPEAWNLNTGSRSVVVGVIDTGIDGGHTDLAANVWTNPHEVAGNGVDDDHNGYVDDVHGWDFYNGDSNPQDDHGHGTHVSGTLGAVGNNSVGVSGVCWKVSIVGLKFLGANGNGVTSDAIEAIYYATSIDALLTSNSWTGGEYELLMKAAIEDADAHGSLFVAAAGNEGTDNDASARYPSGYLAANVIAVASVNRAGALSNFSSYGATSVDIGAPGEEIYSTTAGGGYGTMSGTSMATPMVSGTCALLKAFKPALSHHDIKSIVLGSAQPLASLSGKCATGGLLNARVALEVANDLSVSPGDMFVAVGESGLSVVPSSRTYTVTNNGSTTAAWTSSTTQSWLSLAPASGTLLAGQSVSVVATLQPSANGLSLGAHSAAFTIVSTGTGRAFTRPVSVEITPRVVLNASMDSSPGWTLEGLWQYGQPMGQGGAAHGNPDPVAGVTGVNVIGMNLAGDYASVSAGPFYATAPAVDLSQYQGAILRFQSWLNCDYKPWCVAEAQISTDGSTWTTVFSNSASSQTMQSAWTRQEINISSLVDGRSNVQLRFGYETESGVYAYSGWNLDDVQILANPVKSLGLAMSVPTVQEGAAGVAVTLTVNPVPVSALLVNVASSKPEQASVSSATVTVPPGQPSVTFTVNAVNDTWLDGSQQVTISASASEYPVATTSVTVHDNETAPLAIAVASTATEGDLPLTAILSVPSAVAKPVVVALSSNDLTEVTVPATVTLPEGSTQVTFPVTVVDDQQIDGNQAVAISASVVNWTSGQGNLQVQDNETMVLALDLLAGVGENRGTVSPAGTVRLSGTYPSDVVVSFSSSDVSRILTPPSVTIPAGATQASVQITVVNDPAHTGQVGVTLTAQATGFTPGTSVVQVYDLQSVAVAAMPSPADLATQVSPETDLSWDVVEGSGLTPQSFDVYFGTTANLGAGDMLGTTSAKSWGLPRLSRGGTYYWRINSHNAGDTAVGPVWRFTVAPIGAVDHYVWSGVPTSTQVEVLFNATVTAKDLYDDTVTGFAGSVALSTQTGAAEVLITEVAYDAIGAVELTNVSPNTVDVSGWTVVLYKEGTWPMPARTVTLSGLSIPAGGVLSVRGGGTAGGSYPTIYIGEAIGWAPASRVAVMVRNGSGTIVDFMSAGGLAGQIASPVAVPDYHWAGAAIATSGAGGSSYVRTAGEDTQTAGDWSVSAVGMGTLNAGLLVPFPGTGAALPVVPSTVTLNNGQWTGSVRIGKPHARTRLVVVDTAGKEGRSGLVQVTSLGALSVLPLVTAATEGAGTVNNAVVVSLPAPGVGETVVNVVSSASSEVGAGSFTIPAGQTLAVLPLTVGNDTVLDGSQTISVQIYAAGYEGASFAFTVHDNEATTLAVSAPSSAMEEAGTPLQGIISVPVAPATAVTVGLVSSRPARATVPASVVIPAGATSVPFAIQLVNDAYVNGTQTVQFTASVTNWGSGSASMAVQDDEVNTIDIDVQQQVNEGTGSLQGTVTIAGLAQESLTFALASSLPGQLSVASTVTINAGESTGTFTFTPVDDTAKDGLAEVTISVSAAGFASNEVLVLVADNDAHTFSASTITGTKTEGVRFLWTIEARDINGALMDTVAGPLSLSITSNTGAVGFAPVTGGPFVRGVWNAQMRVLAPATGVRFTLAAPSATVQSNAFDVGMGPRIEVSPPAVSATVLQDLSADRTVTVSNNGTGVLNWAVGVNTTTLLSTSPAFVAVPSSGPFPGVSPVYVGTAHASLCPQDSLTDHVPLETVLGALDTSSSEVTNLIPVRYDFTEGADLWYIVNGGDNAFNYGNVLTTDLTPEFDSLPYSDGVVTARSDFGASGRYVTRKVPGLFMMAADLDNVSTLDVTGGLGALSSGTVDGAMLRVTRQGKAYKVMVKRVYNAQMPSVNHLVIVPDVSGLNHQFAQDSRLDDHRITGLQRAARLYYLMFTLKSGRYLSNDEAAVIGERFLELVTGGTWLHASPESGSLTAGSSQNVTVTLSSQGQALGTFTGGLTFISDDEVRSPSSVSASLTVNASVPTLVTEPAFTGGTSNALSWDNLGTGMEYELQRDSSVAFGAPVSSGWKSGTMHTFSDIPEGVQQSYRVRSRIAGQTGWTSRWSAVVSSTQDASGPVIVFALPSSGFTGQTTLVAQGAGSDLSGIASLWFAPAVGAQVQAQTTDQYTHWTASLPGLVMGQNVFTITAMDLATPANSTVVSWNVTRIDPNAPAEGSGVAPVLAAAFNIPTNAEASAVQPQMGSVEGVEGKRYLTISYRRRIQASGFTYVVETSSNLINWTSTAGDVTEMGTTPTGDGVTETCTCRISPAFGEAGQKFVRVRPVLN